MRRPLATALFSLALAASACTQAASAPLYLNTKYSETRSPAADVAAGSARAKAEGKRVLLEVGGDWCTWCHILDRYLAANADVSNAFAQSFVVVKVNYSPAEKNEAFLSRYPKIAGYPAFIILDAEGELLGTQDTGKLEEGESYNKARMLAFAETWRAK